MEKGLDSAERLKKIQEIIKEKLLKNKQLINFEGIQEYGFGLCWDKDNPYGLKDTLVKNGLTADEGNAIVEYASKIFLEEEPSYIIKMPHGDRAVRAQSFFLDPHNILFVNRWLEDKIGRIIPEMGGINSMHIPNSRSMEHFKEYLQLETRKCGYDQSNLKDKVNKEIKKLEESIEEQKESIEEQKRVLETDLQEIDKRKHAVEEVKNLISPRNEKK